MKPVIKQTVIIVLTMLLFNIHSTAGTYSDTAYHIDADFAEHGFGFVPGASTVKKQYGTLVTIKKKPVGNLHDHNVRDTIVSVSGAGIRFNFYKSQSDTGLMNATITSPKVILINNIHVGMAKNEWQKLFAALPAAATVANVIQVGNEEHTFYFEFVFVKSKLTAIKYYSLAD